MASEFATPDPVRYFLAIWSLLSAILSFVGNTVVLVASRKFRAFKVDKVSVTLIDNLAVADLGYTLVGIVPTIGALITNRWPYGRQFCVVNKVLTNIFFNMTILLVSLLSVSKLTCLLFPVHARTRKSRHAVLLVSFVWLLDVAYCVASTLASDPNVYYDTVSFQCWVNYQHKIPFGSILVGWMIVMNVIIIITTTWLLIQVKKVSLVSGLTKGSIAIVAISAIFTIATLPAAVVMILKMAHVPFGVVTGAVCNVATTYIFYISNFFNPVIYYFSIRSFKRFVDTKLFKLDASNSISSSVSPSKPSNSNFTVDKTLSTDPS